MKLKSNKKYVCTICGKQTHTQYKDKGTSWQCAVCYFLNIKDLQPPKKKQGSQARKAKA